MDLKISVIMRFQCASQVHMERMITLELSVAIMDVYKINGDDVVHVHGKDVQAKRHLMFTWRYRIT